MLVLSRRMGETVVIGDDIKVTVLSATGTQVRIGINAPQTVSVHREEVYKRINKEGSASSETIEPKQVCASI